jgi:predicted membrane protein (TIGR00267 family)
MVRDEFGIDPRVADESGLRGPLSMGLSYAIGSLVPIAAFLLPLSMQIAIVISLACAIVGLFAVGFYAGTLSLRNPVIKGLEIVFYGCGIFALSYLAGHFIPPLFGHAPVPLGG